MQDFVFTMNLCVKDYAAEKLKDAVDHHLSSLVNLDDWPEITGVWDAQLVRPEDIKINKIHRLKED